MRKNSYPECRWVHVVDRTGRRHLEMRWELSGRPVAAFPSPAASLTSRAA